jgi:hypothetical protein
MNSILKTTLATAFAAACLAGASVTFAADNNGHETNNPGSGIGSKADKGMNNGDSDVLQTDPTQTNSTTTTCDNNSANQQNCMKNGMQNTPQQQQ